MIRLINAGTEAHHLYLVKLAEGKKLDDLLVPAFATVREAAKRTLGQRHFGKAHLGSDRRDVGDTEIGV